MSSKQDLRDRRKQRLRYQIRQKSHGRPRLSVFRSEQNIYAQIIDDTTGSTLAQASSRDDVKALVEGKGKVGVVGFCYGGGIANLLATQVPELAAAVPFYGGQPPAAEAAKIKSPLLIHYAGKDERVNAGWPAYEAALKAAGVRFDAHIYPGVEHGFNNDTTPRFDAAAAGLAWSRTMAFFKTQLA